MMERDSDTGRQRGKVRLYGRPGTGEGYEIRDFLRRTVVSFEWIELASDDDGHRELGLSSLAGVQLPVVEFPDGSRLFAPTVREIADRLGWVVKPKFEKYDLSIYGAGPAGLSAAVYAASEGLRTVLIERHAVGGQAGTSSMIENYLGFPDGVSGAELAERARQQAVKFGVELLLMREGVKAEFREGGIYVDMADGSEMVARANICATGVEYRRLNLKDEARFLNAGLYYGAGAAEAPMCRNQHVYVVGGGNSAGQAAMHFADYADQVTLIVRGGSLAASLSQYLTDRIQQRNTIAVRYHTSVTALAGDTNLEQITLTDSRDGSSETVPAHRLFICIGGSPNTEWAKDTAILRDPAGYLITGSDLLTDAKLPECWPLVRDPYFLETSVPGSFAAGDVRHRSVKRVASAVGEGAMAVTFAHKYLEETA